VRSNKIGLMETKKGGITERRKKAETSYLAEWRGKKTKPVETNGNPLGKRIGRETRIPNPENGT